MDPYEYLLKKLKLSYKFDQNSHETLILFEKMKFGISSKNFTDSKSLFQFLKNAIEFPTFIEKCRYPIDEEFDYFYTCPDKDLKLRLKNLLTLFPVTLVSQKHVDVLLVLYGLNVSDKFSS